MNNMVYKAEYDDLNDLRVRTVRLEQIVKALYDSTQSFVILVSPEFEILFFNKQALHSIRMLLGVDLKRGDNLTRYIGDGHQNAVHILMEHVAQVFLTGRECTTEGELKINSTSSWLRTVYSPICDEDKITSVLIRIVDISERRLKETRIEQQKQKLSQISWLQSPASRLLHYWVSSVSWTSPPSQRKTWN